MDFWYNLTKQILKGYLAVCIQKIHVKGEENLQPGPKIIAANHPNLSDGFVLPFIIKEKLHFLIQSSTFNMPIIRVLLVHSDQIPVVPGYGHEALNNAIDKLSEGKVIVIFPEGKLNHGEKLRRGRSGVAILALKSGAPIVPVGFYVPQENTGMWRGRIRNRITKARWQLRGECYVQIGKPWQVSPLNLSTKNPTVLRATTKNIMLRISEQITQARTEALRLRENSIPIRVETLS